MTYLCGPAQKTLTIHMLTFTIMRKLALLAAVALGCAVGQVSAQTLPKRTYQLPDATPFAALIHPDTLKPWLDVLASKSMEGRETGQRGQRLAADYIANQFKAMGLPPKAERNTYFQEIHLQNESWKDISLIVDGQTFQDRADFYVYAAYNPDLPVSKLKEVVFVGYGIDDKQYSDYGKMDVKGKAVLFYDGEPIDSSGKSLVTGTFFRSNWSVDWRQKVQKAKEKGATMAFIVDNKIAENLKNNRRKLSSYGWKPYSATAASQNMGYIPNLFISPTVAAAILGKKAEKTQDLLAAQKINKGAFEPIALKQKIEVHLDKEVKTLDGSNVLGVIEGSDYKDEYVFVTAHYDHLGATDSTVVFYGADDNASGTCAVMNIAKAFAEAKKAGNGPKRTVVCMLVSGEEKGLLGSKYYVEYPVFDLKNTVVDINIDMIGRTDAIYKDSSDYIYVIGSDRLSTELHRINEMNNKERTKLKLDYRYNAKDEPNHYYERSDHYNFALQGVPAIFYFNGTHPDYHRPTDTADKINFPLLAKRAQLAFYTAWEIANRPWRLVVDVK